MLLLQGFHKILKKHDKCLPHAPCRQFYVAHLHQQPWVQVCSNLKLTLHHQDLWPAVEASQLRHHGGHVLFYFSVSASAANSNSTTGSTTSTRACSTCPTSPFATSWAVVPHGVPRQTACSLLFMIFRSTRGQSLVLQSILSGTVRADNTKAMRLKRASFQILIDHLCAQDWGC